jgi:hypothetical protein
MLIGVSGLVVEPAGSGQFSFAAGLTAVATVLIFRTLRMAIIAKLDGLLMRGIFRSRRIPFNKIRGIEAIEQPNMYGIRGATIAIHTVDGRRIVAGEFWSPVARSGNAPRVDAIVRELNRWRTVGTVDSRSVVDNPSASRTRHNIQPSFKNYRELR